MLVDFVAGSLGGAAGVLAGHPLDTLKVRLQTTSRYRSMAHCVVTMVREEGLGSLYKGITPPLISLSVVNAIVFGIHGTALRLMPNKEETRYHFAAGAVSGLCQSIVSSPMELAKTRLQLQGMGQPDFGHFSTRSNADVYRGPIHCLRQVYRASGYRGVMRGWLLTAMRDGPGYGSYFWTYEVITRSIDSRGSDYLRAHHLLFAGGMAGIASWVVTYPCDVVKTRLQADGVYLATQRYRNGRECARELVRKEGYAALLKGFWPTVARAFVLNSVTFWAVETSMKSEWRRRVGMRGGCRFFGHVEESTVPSEAVSLRIAEVAARNYEMLETSP